MCRCSNPKFSDKIRPTETQYIQNECKFNGDFAEPFQLEVVAMYITEIIGFNSDRFFMNHPLYSTRISIQHGKCLVKSVGEEENQYLILLQWGHLNFLLFMFPRGIKLPAGNRYLPGNSPNYLQLADAYHVEKFE